MSSRTRSREALLRTLLVCGSLLVGLVVLELGVRIVDAGQIGRASCRERVFKDV